MGRLEISTLLIKAQLFIAAIKTENENGPGHSVLVNYMNEFITDCSMTFVLCCCDT